MAMRCLRPFFEKHTTYLKKARFGMNNWLSWILYFNAIKTALKHHLNVSVSITHQRNIAVKLEQQPAIILLYPIEETFIFFIYDFPNSIFTTSFSDNQVKVWKLFEVSLYLAQRKAHVLATMRNNIDEILCQIVIFVFNRWRICQFMEGANRWLSLRHKTWLLIRLRYHAKSNFLCASDRDWTWFNDRPDISKAPFAEQKFMVRAVLPVRTFLTPLKRH